MTANEVDGVVPETTALVQRMYPSPHRLDTGRSDQQRVRFVAVPSAADPRLLADSRLPALVARVVRGHSPAAKLHMRVARNALAAAARLGLYARVPGTTLTVHGQNDLPSIEDPLRTVLGVPEVRLAMSFGPRRANRKPVLQVVDEAGTVLAFAKVGHNDLTHALVHREAAALTTLATRPWHDVVVPTVLGVLEWRDLTLLVQSPLAMPDRRARDAAARARLLTVIDEIAVSAGRSTSTWSTHPLRVRLFDRLSAGGTHGQLWQSQLSELPGDVTVATGCWHGDLNPGNVALTSGPCPVWDWERYEADVPLGFDLLHHDLQDALTRQGKEPATAAAELLRAAPELLARWGHDPVQADLVCRAYLITLADRYLADDQEGAGARLGAVQNWILPVLSGTAS